MAASIRLIWELQCLAMWLARVALVVPIVLANHGKKGLAPVMDLAKLDNCGSVACSMKCGVQYIIHSTIVNLLKSTWW